MRVLITVIIAASVISCSSGLRPPTSPSQGSLCIVTAKELRAQESTSVYDALRLVRPSLLRRNLRGELPIVIVDGAVTNDAYTALQGLQVEEIQAIRRLSAIDAAQRYGLHQSNSVLEVITVRPGNKELDNNAWSCS
jgi:hypothetical protein